MNRCQHRALGLTGRNDDSDAAHARRRFLHASVSLAALSMPLPLSARWPGGGAATQATASIHRPDRQQVVEYDSPAVGLRLKYTVLFPDADLDGEQRYPVLYLLHGHTGHHRSWLDYAGLPKNTATRLRAIVVLADGGNGMYTNWHGAISTRPNRWEDAIVVDLIADVDRRCRTRAERGGRAIGGLSMGGYGAVAIALRRPDIFAAAFSSAGALRFAARAREELRTGQDDWNRPELWSKDDRPPVAIPDFSTQRERTPQGRVFVTDAQAAAADPFALVDAIDPVLAPMLHLDCGLSDSLLPETLAFAERLRARALRHSLWLGPGDHDTPYWAQAFEHSALRLDATFATPPIGAEA